MNKVKLNSNNMIKLSGWLLVEAKPGDSVYGYYKKYKKAAGNNYVSPYRFIKLVSLGNNGTDPNKIQAGKKYLIPSGTLPTLQFLQGSLLRYKNPSNYLKRIGFKPVKYKGETIYRYSQRTNKGLLPLFRNIYGDKNSQKVNDAVNWRYDYTQRNRAKLLDLRYNKNMHYPVPYTRALDQRKSSNAKNGYYLGKPIQKPTRYNRLNPLWYKISPDRAYSSRLGGLGLIDSASILHLLGHNFTPSMYSIGTSGPVRIVPKASSGDKGNNSYKIYKYLDKKYKNDTDKLNHMYHVNANREKNFYRVKNKRFNNFYVHPSSSYFNSGVLAGTALNQLFGYAANHGQKLKNWRLLRDWMTGEGYVVRDPKTGFYKARPLPGMVKLNYNVGLELLLQIQNDILYMKRKPNRTLLLTFLLMQKMRNLSALSTLADNTSRQYNRRANTYGGQAVV